MHRLSHDVNGKKIEPSKNRFKFMMEIDRLAVDLQRLRDRSVTELRECVIIVVGLSAGHEVECRLLENNATGFEKAEIDRVIENQYNRLLRQ